jgi:formylglycine-generating enzyme required for sulfatase activity
MICSAPTAEPNRANCASHDSPQRGVLNAGSYPGSASPYGTYDQGGNVWEWNEEFFYRGSALREARGGAYNIGADATGASQNLHPSPTIEATWLGFRLAMIPEPNTGLLVIAGLLGLAGWRRLRA